MTLGEARQQYIQVALKTVSQKRILIETRQLLLDVMDLVEQTEEELPVTAGYRAMDCAMRALYPEGP